MTEAQIQAEIMLKLGRGETRLFRNHTGRGWTGDLVQNDRGTVVLRNARPATFGLCVGSSDLIGFRKRLVTPDMIGRQIAQFLAIEVKAPGGRPTDEQRRFIDAIDAAGGLAGIARSVDQARLVAELAETVG